MFVQQYFTELWTAQVSVLSHGIGLIGIWPTLEIKADKRDGAHTGEKLSLNTDCHVKQQVKTNK